MALAVLVLSVVFLVWSELGLNGNFPPWLAWALNPLGISKIYSDLPWAKPLQDYLIAQGARSNFGDYAYCLFMGLAITIAAIAIVMIGREDAEEKTVLPVKK
jgi:hypothetical protein